MVIRGIRSSEKASFRRFPEIYSQYCFFSLIIIKITINSKNKFEIRRFLLLQLPDVPAILAHPAPAVNHFLSSFSEGSQFTNTRKGAFILLFNEKPSFVRIEVLIFQCRSAVSSFPVLQMIGQTQYSACRFSGRRFLRNVISSPKCYFELAIL